MNRRQFLKTSAVAGVATSAVVLTTEKDKLLVNAKTGFGIKTHDSYDDIYPNNGKMTPFDSNNTVFSRVFSGAFEASPNYFFDPKWPDQERLGWTQLDYAASIASGPAHEQEAQ